MLNTDKNQNLIVWFATLSSVVQTFSAQQLYDLNKYSEAFFAKLFTLLLKIEFTQMDLISKNYPAIDLGSKNNTLSIQVTSNLDKDKIHHTINTFIIKKLNYTNLSFLELRYVDPSQKASNHWKILNTLCTANATNRIWNDELLKDIIFYDLFKVVHLIQNIENNDYLEFEKIYKLCEYYLPAVQSSFTQESVEVAHLRQVFVKLSEACKSDLTLQTPNISESDIALKRERFKDYWTHIQSMLTILRKDEWLGQNRYYTVMSSFDEASKQIIINYLQIISIEILSETNNNPIEAIKKLSLDIIKKSNLSEYYESDIKGFLYYHFMYCNVFPNPDNSI